MHRGVTYFCSCDGANSQRYFSSESIRSVTTASASRHVLLASSVSLLFSSTSASPVIQSSPPISAGPSMSPLNWLFDGNYSLVPSTFLTIDTVKLHYRIWGGGEALRIAHINIRSLVPHFSSIIDLFMWVWYTRDQRNLAERGRLRVALNIDNYHFIHCQIYNIDRFIGNRDGGIALYIITCRAHPLISLSLQLIFLSM